MKRLQWIDISKGLAILFVVYFHFFRTVFEHYQPPPSDWSGLLSGTMSILRAAWWQISGLGFHAVGAFIILSGWTLMQSTMARAETGNVAWGKWYGARFVRLYPMYWVAHLVYLLSPFIARLEPVDERIVLSLLGLRFIDISMNFMYLNAAWWYFGMLIQFYLIFPLLFGRQENLEHGLSCSARARSASSFAISCSMFIQSMVCGLSAASPFVACPSSLWEWRSECGTQGLSCLPRRSLWRRPGASAASRTDRSASNRFSYAVPDSLPV